MVLAHNNILHLHLQSCSATLTVLFSYTYSPLQLHLQSCSAICSAESSYMRNIYVEFDVVPRNITHMYINLILMYYQPPPPSTKKNDLTSLLQSSSTLVYSGIHELSTTGCISVVHWEIKDAQPRKPTFEVIHVSSLLGC